MGPVVIIGAGAMGTWLAARLHAAGRVPVILVAREGHVPTIEANGIRVDRPFDDDGHLVVSIGHGLDVIGDESLDASTLAKVDDVPYAVVTVRAYQTDDAIETLQRIGIAPHKVVTLQNGLGNAERLAEAYGPDRVIAGTTTHGVTYHRPGHVTHAGPGDTTIGPWQATASGSPDENHAGETPSADDFATILTRAGIPTQVVDDPRPILWRKLIVNAAINPLTALHRVANGALATDAALTHEMERLATEAGRVATAEGVTVSDEDAIAAARSVAERTASNRSSMLQARDAGKPLELDAITGEVVRRARRHGIAVPANEALMAAFTEAQVTGRGDATA